MALETIIPSADGATAGATITLFGAATKWQALLTNDAATSYVDYTWTVGANCYALVRFTSPVLQAATAINSVKPYTIARYVGAATVTRMAINLPATGVWFGADQNLTLNWDPYSEVRTTRPVTGAPWTVPDMLTMEFGAAAKNPSQQRHTQHYAIVDYVPAPGFWASLVYGLFGPLVGIGMGHAAGMARALQGQRLTRPTRAEYPDFIREIREGLNPRHFILGRT